ncbi:MAG TPA: pirin family protein [Planctomycetota bacterium]|nr:pirin family protein [Planctomycetota bacterium]
MATARKPPKKVLEIRSAPEMHWVGNGFPVRTMFSYDDDPALVSPFLLLDYAAPAKFPPSAQRRGVGAHPHRGIETVTIVWQGEVEHRDSAGHHGKIGPGDVQWMTAASGVFHDEFHGADFTRGGGTFEVAQVWVNLPAKLKMSAPRYQDLLDRDIPSVELPKDAGRVRVVSGDFMGTRGPAKTYTPVSIWELRLRRGVTELAVPDGHSAMLLVTRGRVGVDGTSEVKEGQLAILDRRGEAIALEARDTGQHGEVTALFLSGEPIPEPVVGYGPFVMNTEDEIRQAIADVQSGRMGRLS